MSSLRKRRQPHHFYHHRIMDPQIAKHQPMMLKQPDVDGWLGHQSVLTYNTFCFVLIDMTLIKESDLTFPLMRFSFTRLINIPISGSKAEMLCNVISLSNRALSLQKERLR